MQPLPRFATLDWPVLRLGFRPFYLGAAGSAVALMLLWRFIYTGSLRLPSGLDPMLWHAHEMIFGVVVATIVGFLFTAGKTWTNLPTPRGAHLGALFILWLSARVASVVSSYLVYLVLDLAFLPITAALFLDLLVRAGNQRNLPIACILVLLSTVNLCFHLSAIGAAPWPPVQFLYAGIGLVVTLEHVIAGRVIPMFTRAVTPGLKIEANGRRDGGALAFMVAGLAMWAVQLWPAVSALSLVCAAGLQAWRLASWHPWVSRKRPILWVLHLSYAWLCIGLVFLAAAQVGLAPVSMGVHSLTVGAIGGMIIGMMSRTARGHTGRVLQSSNAETTAYVLILSAATARVVAPALPVIAHTSTLVVAGLLWIAGFSLYLYRFTPWLMSARMDGKDG